MRKFVWMSAVGIAAMMLPLAINAAQSKDDSKDDKAKEIKAEPFKAEQQASKGSVTVEGSRMDYDAYAGTFVVHPKGWNDVPQPSDKDDKDQLAVASMFYVAYFKSNTGSAARPVTFFYNGGPGSSTVWLHMGAFGPKRVVTLDDSHTPAAPYPFINNDYSLLDATDLVFIDAPGTGFSRITGKDAEKNFYGVDQDAYAFSSFIQQFLNKYERWNSPKYLFGESYGTPRSAVLINMLEQDDSIDFNGVILLSQILNFGNSVDDVQFDPGVDLPYELALPTYAATAWYHHKLPNQPGDLQTFLKEVEHFAMHEYADALAEGAKLAPEQRNAIAEKLHQYTGLPVSYIEKGNLRINGGEFEKTLQSDVDLTTGRLDSRFSGPTMDPLSEEAAYDPQSAAIGSAYVSAFNDYVRKDLKYGENKNYKPETSLWMTWNFLHQPPGSPMPMPQATNTLPDLASAMKYNPNLKIMLNGGYFDLATPFFEGIFEMQHLPIPEKLQNNIEYKYYESGHMVYAHQESLKQIHDNVVDFIHRTQTPKAQ